MPGPYQITLTQETPTFIKFERRGVFRLKVTASAGQNMPNEIFGHQRTLIDPVTGEEQDEFCFICSPFDLSTYPANEPSALQTPAFFRKDTLDILLPGVEMAQETVDEITAQVTHLISLLESLDVLNESTTTVIGDEEVTPSSSSSSSSV